MIAAQGQPWEAPIDPFHGFPEHFPPWNSLQSFQGKSVLGSHETGLWGLPRAFPRRLSYILLFCHPFVPARPVYSTRLSQPGPCIPPVCPSQARVFHPFVPARPVYSTRLSQLGPCIPPVCPSPGPCAVQAVRSPVSYILLVQTVRSPVQCAVQARAQSRPACSPIEETQASVYTHLASNGARKEWPSCQKREKEGNYSFSEGWKPAHLFYWKDL